MWRDLGENNFLVRGMEQRGNIPASNSILYELEAIFSKGGTVKIHCPFCGKQHTHGALSGWRSAHCQQGEYYIKEIGKK